MVVRKALNPQNRIIPYWGIQENMLLDYSHAVFCTCSPIPTVPPLNLTGFIFSYSSFLSEDPPQNYFILFLSLGLLHRRLPKVSL